MTLLPHCSVPATQTKALLSEQSCLSKRKMSVASFSTILTFFFISMFSSASGEWYDSNWGRRRPITITNTTGAALTNYQVKITASYDSDMQSDFKDIRLTQGDGVSLIAHWVESYTPSTSADFWVKVPSISTTVTTIYMYYSNPSASSASNLSATFSSGSFSDTFTDSSKINTTDSSSISVAGGHVEIETHTNEETFTATEDSRVVYQSPDTNFGSETFFALQGWKGPPAEKQRSFVKFDISSIPMGVTVNDVDFQVYYWSDAAADSGGRNTLARRITGPWSESTITWNNQPGATDTDEVPFKIPATYGWMNYDADAIVQSWVTGSEENYGFLTRFPTERSPGNYAPRFRSWEYTTDRPKLTVNWTEHYTSATLTSITIPEDNNTRLALGNQLSWNDSEPADTDVRYQTEYRTNGSWELIPDSVLSGNSVGFDTSPVDISPVKTDYNQIRLRGNLSTSDVSTTPTVTDWTVSYYNRKCSFPEPSVSIGSEEILNRPPNAPSSLGPSFLIDGDWRNNNTPTLEFTQSDPDVSDTVRYQIQIDDTSDFSSSVVDYSSALLRQGNTSFTVGQTASGGTYTSGSEGQTLSDDSYYWRVRSTDSNGTTGSWTIANSGSIAFSVDTTPPTTCSVSINNDATYTNSPSVTLELSASDSPSSGVSALVVSNNSSFEGVSWEEYAACKSWTLTSGSGIKTVYVQFKDGADNVSETYSDTIILDSLPPTGSILINGDNLYTTSPSVSLTLSASDNLSGASGMIISNTSSFEGCSWEDYATSRSWALTSGDGTKTVYVKFEDRAGQVSDTYSDEIILDTNPPTTTLVGHPTDIVTGDSPKVEISFSWIGSDPDGLTPSDELLYQYRLEGHTDYVDWSDWTPKTNKTYLLPSGNYTFSVRCKDGAGSYPPEDNEKTAKCSFTVSLPIIVYPNPCDLSQAQIVTFANLSLGSQVKVYIYDLGGSLVRILGESEATIEGGSKTATWDCRNNNGELVTRDIYIYFIPGATEMRIGKIAIME